MKVILYHFSKHKKINGTLFYAFEYFIFCAQLDSNILFYIYDISDQDLFYIKNIFKERYSFDLKLLDKCVAINQVKGLLKQPIHRWCILDIRTFKKLHYFLKADILCYSNIGHDMLRSSRKKITYYGAYAYQNFDKQVYLKLNFSLFKKINKSLNQLLVSSPMENYLDFNLPEKFLGKKKILKKYNTHHSNFFASFDSLHYFHSSLDTNNRLIPECMYYKKDIYIQGTGLKEDSVELRYKDIKLNGLKAYTLNKDDILVQDFLSS